MGYLGVEQSLTGRRWLGLSPEAERQAERISQITDLPDALARILARLDVPADEAEGYLAPQIRDLLPDPQRLRDMGAASQRILSAVKAHQRIAVFADYDVDGGSSAALLITWFRALGLPSTLYVPDRIDEGYGPNAPAMQELASRHDLIICVDCGTLSHDAIAAAEGADVIVLDHHLGADTLPPALAVVNPNRQDEDGSLSHLCAAAVVFLCLVDCNRQMREAGETGPDLMAMMDLVGLATVADVAPLVGVNRAFVRRGLDVMALRQRIGLVALADAARLNAKPTSYHLGYVLGPRINAGGRIGQADLGARLLSTEDGREAAELAAKLDHLNTERREIETAVKEAALAKAEALGDDTALAWAAEDGWHPGVVGIVAARLKEAMHRPSVVIGFDGDIGKGSGRSVKGVDLGASVQRLAAEGLIEKGGGHPMAAGLTLTRAQLKPAMERLDELLARQGAGAHGPGDLSIDAVLMPGAATADLITQIETAGPFGQSARSPVFAFPDQTILFAKRVGDAHLKVSFGDGLGNKLEGIAFGAMNGPMGPTLLNHNGERFHIAGRLEINHWGGRETPQLQITDAAKTGKKT